MYHFFKEMNKRWEHKFYHVLSFDPMYLHVIRFAKVQRTSYPSTLPQIDSWRMPLQMQVAPKSVPNFAYKQVTDKLVSCFRFRQTLLLYVTSLYLHVIRFAKVQRTPYPSILLQIKLEDAIANV